MANELSLGAVHLLARHGFGFDDLEPGIPENRLLEEIHADLHEQEAEHGLPTHSHQWLVIEIASGAVVSSALPTEDLAMEYALAAFGPEAGKEYVVRWSWEESA